MHGRYKTVSGRPLGDVSQALVRAARVHCTADRCPTLSELAAHSGVSYEVARNAVPKLKDRGHLVHVRDRKVEGRNRPAMEYAPAVLVEAEVVETAPWVDLNKCLSGWVG